MKAVISIDSVLYQKVEDTARLLGLSRSKFYSFAVDEYVRNHQPDMITERLNAVYCEESSALDEDVRQLQYNLLASEDW